VDKHKATEKGKAKAGAKQKELPSEKIPKKPTKKQSTPEKASQPEKEPEPKPSSSKQPPLPPPALKEPPKSHKPALPSTSTTTKSSSQPTQKPINQPTQTAKKPQAKRLHKGAASTLFRDPPTVIVQFYFFFITQI
jgi:hypothetical protein